MGIKEIFEEESNNTNSIILRKEGLFWRAYDVSAWLFITNLKAYNPTKKFYKVISNEVVHIGFPENKIEELLQLAQTNTQCTISKEEKRIKIKINNANVSDFTSWKEKLKTKEKETISIEKDIIKQIQEYPIANKTPIDAQLFIIKLQKQLNGTL